MSKEGISVVGFFIVLVVIAGGFFLWGTGVYDNAVTYQEEINKSWADVQATYQRRADLVPNLVATVKGAAENEQNILLKVTQARAGITNAKTPEDLELAGKEINSAINLAFEAYPQIRATENFRDLQSQLEGTENRINVARQRYNETVARYNSHVRGFLRKKALAWFGSGEDFSTRTGFTATEGAETVPEVKF